MTTCNLIPPSSGVLNSITVNGRTYASAPGVAIPVPDFDAAILEANGWMIQPTTATINSTTSTVTAATTLPVLTPGYYFQGMVNPPSTSQATVQGLLGEAIYAAGAAAITAPGHLIGTLGHLTNNNVTFALGLGIGAEGRIDNFGTMTIAQAVNCNFTNYGTATTSYGAYSDVINTGGTITTAVAFGCNISANTGTISSYMGLFFPTLSGANATTGLFGLYFNNNPGVTAAKYAVYCADPNASITTLGPIATTNKTTTATFQLDTGAKTATAVAGAATLNKASGKITTEALTTAAGATYTLTLTNSQIAAADTVFASLANGTNSAGDPAIGLVTPGAGSVTIAVVNRHASAALNGTLVISFISMKA
jgi:hypothetical protein